jgi:glycosyltransferase involved in cell wall biosynthesis
MIFPVSAVFVTYAFPPNGGSGVQRVYKFVKYLPTYGIGASVITAKSVLKTTADSSLLHDLHPDTKVIRAASLDPMFVADLVSRGMSNARATTVNNGRSVKSAFFKRTFEFLLIVRNFLRIPDQYIGWLPFAVAAGLRHLRSIQNPVIVASLPIYSTALVAYCLSRLTGAPLILDFRDGWVDDPYLELPTRFHRKLHCALEKRVVNHAKHLIVYGEWLGDIYKKKYPNTPTTIILNGFDEDDFKFESLCERDENIIKLVYSGSLFQYHREFLEMVFAAVQMIPEQVKARVRLVFAGDIQLTLFDELVERYKLNKYITKLGYIPHKEAIKQMLTADALLFTIPRGDVSSYTSKIFEYLAAHRPIISFVCEEGCGARLLRDFGHHHWLIDYDAERATDVFSRIDQLKSVVFENAPELVARIERKQQAGTLAEIVRKTAAI